MKKEKLTIRRKENSIKLQASKINSFRVKDIEQTAIRVYKDGYIGISGAVGKASETELTNQAVDNLSSKIAYPFELEKNKKDHRDYSETHYSENELMKLSEKIIDSLNKDCGDFIFSESIRTVNTDYRFSNTEGLDLRYQDERFGLGFIVKAKNSPNLFDTSLQWEGRNFDVDRFLSFAKQQLVAERNKVDLPEEGKLPVFYLSPEALGGFLIRHLNGESYGNKVSFFDGKLGKKLFNEKLTVVQNHDPKTSMQAFFDREGVSMPNDKVAFIENGVLKRVFTDKKIADKFNLEHTGSASGGYDDIPRLMFTNMEAEIDSENIAKTLDGKKAIFVMVAAGGDFNADGHYATPVQAAYLFDGKKFLGKLPDFNMSNDVYSMLGKDYIGTFRAEDLYFGEHQWIFGCYMNIKK